MHAHPLEARIANLEGTFGQVNERLGSIERRLDSIDGRFNWVIGLILGTWLTTVVMILLHH